MRITSLRPGDCAVEIELSGAPGDVRCRIEGTHDHRAWFAGTVPVRDGAIAIDRLPNDVELTAIVEAGGVPCGRRLFRCGYVPGTVVNYVHPDDGAYLPSGRCLGSPSMVRLPDGALLMMHDSFLSDARLKDSVAFRSVDDGETWRHAGDLPGCTWSTLYLHGERLLALTNCLEYGRLAVCESRDGGGTWARSGPIEGDVCRGPTAIARYGGRLWAAVGNRVDGRHSEHMLSIDLGDDPMVPSNWTLGAPRPYDPMWPGTVMGACEEHMEGNVVVSPEGRLLIFSRYQTRYGTPAHGKALVLEADPQRPQDAPRFHAVVDFPINMSKFQIQYDPDTLLYWAMGNRVVTDMTEQRNLLSLYTSPDLLHWTLHRDIINYVDNGWFEDERMVGFQYPWFCIEGGDMLVLSRTAVNGAIRYHDSNFMTFHRVRNFRR